MKLLLIVLFSVIGLYTFGQDCDSITASSELVKDNLRLNILSSDGGQNQLWIKSGIGPKGDLNTRTYAPLVKSANFLIGGTTRAGSAKIATGYYNEQNWVPGKLNDFGLPYQENCKIWDKVYSYNKKDIITAREAFLENSPCDDYPESIRNWPGKGNTGDFPTDNGVYANFLDENGDGLYNPCDGDLPHVPSEVGFRGYNSIPNQVSFYVLNTSVKSQVLNEIDLIQSEVLVYNYSFTINGLEDVIFTSIVLVNKSNEDIIDGWFGKWVDFEIGCESNDLLGGDKENQLIYGYNSDHLSENCGANNLSSINPMVGYGIIKPLRRPFIKAVVNGKDTLVDPIPGSGVADTLVKSRNAAVSIPVNCNSSSCLPTNIYEFLYQLQGKDKFGMTLLNQDGKETIVAYSGNPSDPFGWNLCNSTDETMSVGSVTQGPLLMQPGMVNNMVIATVVTTDTDDECPDTAPLIHKLKKAKKLHGCFYYHPIGPTLPNLNPTWIDNSSVRLQLSNIPYQFRESPFWHPEASWTDKYYNFEGIKVYQVASENFDLLELGNESMSKLIYQGDIVNEIDTIWNFEEEFEGANLTYNKVPKVIGGNIGIEEEFVIFEDKLTGEPLNRDSTYFFVVVPYAYNKYESFDPETGLGQQYPYLEGDLETCLTAVTTVTALDSIKTNDDRYNFRSLTNSFELTNVTTDLQVSLHSFGGTTMEVWEVKRGFPLSFEFDSNYKSGLYLVSIRDLEKSSMKTFKVVVIH